MPDVTLLAAAIVDERVRSGAADEADAQRCALRCWAQCTYPAPAVDGPHCMHVCERACADESTAAVDAVRAAAPGGSLAEGVLVLAAVLAFVYGGDVPSPHPWLIDDAQVHYDERRRRAPLALVQRWRRQTFAVNERVRRSDRRLNTQCDAFVFLCVCRWFVRSRFRATDVRA